MRTANRDVLSSVGCAALLLAWGCGDSKPSCVYALAPSSASFAAAGGTGTVSVRTGSTCDWTASSSALWVNISSGSSGKGDGTVQYTVASYSGTSARLAEILVAGQSSSVSQAGVSVFTLSGTVMDAFLGIPLADVTVVISSGPTGGSAVTTAGGGYILPGLLPGNYVLSFSAPRFVTSTSSVTVSANTTLNASLALSTASSPSTSDLTGAWSGTGSYPNAPFKLELFQSGTRLTGVYKDQHDLSLAVSGTYSSTEFVLRVDFGDAVLVIECVIDNARQIHGVMRVSVLANFPYPYTMAR